MLQTPLYFDRATTKSTPFSYYTACRPHQDLAELRRFPTISHGEIRVPSYLSILLAKSARSLLQAITVIVVFNTERNNTKHWGN